MRVLVLHDDLDDIPLPREAVEQHVSEGRERGQLAGHLSYDTAVRRATLVLLLAAGCVRDPDESLCPDVAAGDLAITEIGGPQTGSDTLKPWIELYNASGRSVDLQGLKVRFLRLTGEVSGETIVRRSLVVDPGRYVVLGLAVDEDRPAYTDYGISADFHISWPSQAAVDVQSCGARIDLLQYTSLPKTGTYSLGVNPPTAEANDLPANWCTDTTTTAGSFPGTPQKANTACP